MKKSIYFLMAIICPLMLTAQWEQIFSPPEFYLLNNIKFFDDQTGVLLAEDAYINMTQDGGQTWNTLTYPLQSTSPSDFFKFGESKYVVLTDLWAYSSLMVSLNAGELWDDVSPDLLFPQAAGFLNIDLGYCGAYGMDGSTIGNAIYRLEGIGPYQEPEQVYFTDQEGHFDHILCLTDEVILASFEVSDNNPPLPQYTGILLRSDDQGSTWTQVLQLSDNKMFHKIGLSMDGTCIFAHTWEEMFYSTNNGLTWENQEVPLVTVDLLSQQEAYGVVVTSGFGSMIDTLNLAYTDDAWQTWSPQLKIPFAPYITDRSVHLQMISENNGYFAYNNQLYKTTNGGWVGLNENADAKHFILSVTPNPAKDYVCFRRNGKENNQSLEISIFSASGIPVKELILYPGETLKVWDTRSLAAGVYFYHSIQQDGTAACGKLVFE